MPQEKRALGSFGPFSRGAFFREYAELEEEGLELRKVPSGSSIRGLA
jgi:hypothetical protein